MRTFLGAVVLVFSLGCLVIPGEAGNTSSIIIVEGAKQSTKKIKKEELDCMASNIYFEAATQSRIGKIAVAQVTMNRVNSKKFPNSVCEVVFQGPHNPKNPKACQFSWYCDGKPDVIRNKRTWRECVYVAKYVMLGGVPDITLSSTHYHAKYVNPWWAKKLKMTIAVEDHIFYR